MQHTFALAIAVNEKMSFGEFIFVHRYAKKEGRLVPSLPTPGHLQAAMTKEITERVQDARERSTNIVASITRYFPLEVPQPEDTSAVLRFEKKPNVERMDKFLARAYAEIMRVSMRHGAVFPQLEHDLDQAALFTTSCPCGRHACGFWRILREKKICLFL